MDRFDRPILVASRWQIAEFLFVEFLKSDSIIIDVGPLSHDPSDEEMDRVYEYLQNAKLDYLTLGELEWTLDLDQLVLRLPGLGSNSLQGKLVHPAAFEAAGLPLAQRYFAGRNAEDEPCVFLRICFELPDSGSKESPKKPDAPQTGPPDWAAPKIIS